MTTITTGSPKQIAWAEDIKAAYIARLQEATASDDVTVSVMNQHLLDAVTAQGSTDAKTWIDAEDRLPVIDITYFASLRRNAKLGVEFMAKDIILDTFNARAPFRAVYGIAKSDMDAASVAAQRLMDAIAATTAARLAAAQ